MCSNDTSLKYIVIWLFVSPLRFRGNFGIQVRSVVLIVREFVLASIHPLVVVVLSFMNHVVLFFAYDLLCLIYLVLFFRAILAFYVFCFNYDFFLKQNMNV